MDQVGRIESTERILVSLYRDHDALKRLLYNADLDASRFDFDGEYISVLNRSLRIAESQGRLDDVVRAAMRDYPNHDGLKRLSDKLELERSVAADIAGRSADTDDAGGDRVDFFVSHAGTDRGWAEWVAWQLIEAGYTVELDVWDWAAGQDFITAMSDALDRSDRVVALFSAAYLDRSRYTTNEWTAALVHVPGINEGRLVPLRIEKVPTADMPAILRSLVYRNLFGIPEEQARRVLLEAVARPHRPEHAPVFPGHGAARALSRLGASGPQLPGNMPREQNAAARSPKFARQTSREAGTVSTSPPVAPNRIFVSYRRDDTAYPSGWLFDKLTQHFGKDQVFKDIDSIVLGDDFVEVITAAVSVCDALLAIIGQRWLIITDKDGRRRLDNPNDFVRLEIEAAIKRNVRIIPILVDGARMPRAEELPPSLANLARRQALELSPSRFDFDTSRLLKVLDRTLTGT